MNAFILDENLKTSVEYHVDAHVCKIGIEACQMLSTALYQNFGLACGYAPVYQNHPLVKWTGRCVENWEWMAQYAHALFDEYTYRYHKVHASLEVLNGMERFKNDIDRARWDYGYRTDFYLAVSLEFKNLGPVGAYRAYYKKYKTRLFKWTGRAVPYWLVNHVR